MTDQTTPPMLPTDGESVPLTEPTSAQTAVLAFAGYLDRVDDPVLQREDDGSPTHITISAAAFDEIRATLERAGYAFFADTIECEGMTLVRSEP